MKRFICYSNCIIVIALSILYNNVNAQKIEEQSSKYIRNGLSIHFTSASSFSTDIINSLKVSDKFDDNSFGNNILKFDNKLNFNSKEKGNKNKNSIEIEINSEEFKNILESIQNQKMPNKILSKILLNDNGQLDYYKTIFPRGLYNATDNAVLAAQASNENLSVLQSDAVFNVLKNVYFILNQTGSIVSKSSKDATSYTVPFKSYLFQVDLSELFSTNTFFKTFDRKDPDVATKLNNYKFNVKLISVTSGEGNTTDKDLEFEGFKLVTKAKSQQQINLDLAKSTIDEAIIKHSNNYETFKVRTPVFSTGPITAKIGKKEGLRIDDRFEVFRNRIDEKTGEKYAKKLGYLRVAKVADNAKVSTGNTEPSKFYKSPARGVQKNDVLKELPETGIQIGAEVAFGESYFEQEYQYPVYDNRGNISRYQTDYYTKSKSIVMPILNIDYVTHLIRGNRLGVSVAIKDGNPIALAEVKQVIQLNRITFTPGVGYLYYLSVDEKGNSDTQKGGLSGSFKLGFELGKNFQINLGPRFIADAVNMSINPYFGIGIRAFGF